MIVVASLGTAMTDAQGHLLRNNSEQVVIGYDSDGAGQAATMRGLEILQNMGCDIRILQIEGAKDPDEFVVKYGPERFLKQVDNAISLVEYKVSKEAIYAEINKLEKANKPASKLLEKSKPRIEVKTPNIINEQIDKREKLAIYLLINYPNESYEIIRRNININDFKNEKNKNIVKKLYEELEKGNSNINNVLDWFEDEQTINYISWILAYDFEITELNKCITDLINIYAKQNLIDQRNEVIKQLERNDLSKEESEQLEMMLNEIIIKLAKMK